MDGMTINHIVSIDHGSYVQNIMVEPFLWSNDQMSFVPFLQLTCI